MSQNESKSGATKLVLNKDKFFQDINYVPHEFQKKVHESNARFEVLDCGRRWGKSTYAAMEALFYMMKPNQVIWVVAPNYELANKVFREIYWKAHKKLPEFIVSSSMSRQLQAIKFITGSILIAKSADNPVSLLGEGLDYLIIDEAGRVKKEVWQEALRPTLTDKQGKALFISTPRGKNWFYDLFKLGQGEREDHKSWQFPTSTNPYISKEEIEQARETLPRLIFQQEYEAEFLSEEDQFFPQELVDSCIEDIPQIIDPHPKNYYFLGVDFARMGQDSSVFIVAEKDWQTDMIKIVEIIETKHKRLTDAVGRIRMLHRKYKFNRIYLDETGLGAGPTDVLKEELRASVIPITFTNKNKTDLYTNLKLLMEKQRLKIPNNQKLLYQLIDLRYEYTSEGLLRINHSQNGHDDYPDALALSVFFAHEMTTVRLMVA
ncbi:MAG: terminase large subunit [Nanoarchaeota archaeon]